MIEMTLGELRAPMFSQAFRKLMSTPGYNGTASYRIGRLAKAVEKEQRISEESFDKIVKEYAEFKNENGETFWKVPESKKEAWAKVSDEFHSTTIKIDLWKLPMDWAEKANLTPAEFLALEPIINQLEVAGPNPAA